eukprot:Gb_16785 [translate_table: standard]
MNTVFANGERLLLQTALPNRRLRKYDQVSSSHNGAFCKMGGERKSIILYKVLIWILSKTTCEFTFNVVQNVVPTTPAKVPQSALCRALNNLETVIAKGYRTCEAIQSVPVNLAITSRAVVIDAGNESKNRVMLPAMHIKLYCFSHESLKSMFVLTFCYFD